MHILGLDLGTVCGAADGPPGKQPDKIWTWKLKGNSRPEKMANWAQHLHEYFDRRQLRSRMLVFYEEPLPLSAIIRKVNSPAGAQTNNKSVTFHRMLAGILEAVAYKHGVGLIIEVGTQEAWSTMLRQGDERSKASVFAQCNRIGWTCANENESDACAVWAYGASKSNPRLAHLSTPLFGR